MGVRRMKIPPVGIGLMRDLSRMHRTEMAGIDGFRENN
jgi:hypothetical protein